MPGPGLPSPPVPPPPPFASFCPDELPPPVGASDGAGVYFPLPLLPLPVVGPPDPPPLLGVAEPLIGPVASLPDFLPHDGTGT